MSELVGLSGLKSFDQFKSSLRSPSAQTSKSFQISSRQPSYSNSSELASAETDLDLANSKLKQLSEHICSLEEKLQKAYDECGILKVKHEEDEKLLKELESKFHCTKTLCDQLTETLQLLSDQVQDAEKDKVIFANKLSETSVALDNLHGQMKSLSLKLESSEETIRIRDKQLEELGICKESFEKELRDEHLKVLNLTNEKDNLIKNFEETVAANELNERKEKENTALLATNKELTESLHKTMQENQSLENFVKMLTLKLQDLDKQSIALWEKIVKVNSFFDSCFDLLQEEKRLATQKVNEELNNKMSELQNDQKVTIAQHAEECHVAEEIFLKLKSEEASESLLSEKPELERRNIIMDHISQFLSTAFGMLDTLQQDFQLKHSKYKSRKRQMIKNLEIAIHRKEEEIDNLQKVIVRHKQHEHSQKELNNQLQRLLQTKIEQFHVDLKELENKIEDQSTEKAEKQYKQMLESEQLEHSSPLKEMFLRNDEAINVIRKKYVTEKQECINLEKEKAEKAVTDMEKKCEQKLLECKEESKQQLLKIEREHTDLVNKIRMENDKNEENLKSKHAEELKRMQLKAENELKEKTKLMKDKHEAELRELRSQHEEDCKHLEEELNIQKTKEKRQKTLLQMQLEVMSGGPQQDQERKDLAYVNIAETRVSKMLKRAETSHRTMTKRQKTRWEP